MDRDFRTGMTLLEALWSFPDGPLARLRLGEISAEAVDQVVSALEVQDQKERVLERGGDERTYKRLRGRVFAEVKRLLGLGHVDHDVGKWYGDDG